jgi:hypothetical protein
MASGCPKQLTGHVGTTIGSTPEYAGDIAQEMDKYG